MTQAIIKEKFKAHLGVIVLSSVFWLGFFCLNSQFTTYQLHKYFTGTPTLLSFLAVLFFCKRNAKGFQIFTVIGWLFVFGTFLFPENTFGTNLNTYLHNEFGTNLNTYPRDIFGTDLNTHPHNELWPSLVVVLSALTGLIFTSYLIRKNQLPDKLKTSSALKKVTAVLIFGLLSVVTFVLTFIVSAGILISVMIDRDPTSLS